MSSRSLTIRGAGALVRLVAGVMAATAPAAAPAQLLPGASIEPVFPPSMDLPYQLRVDPAGSEPVFVASGTSPSWNFSAVGGAEPYQWSYTATEYTTPAQVEANPAFQLTAPRVAIGTATPSNERRLTYVARRPGTFQVTVRVVDARQQVLTRTVKLRATYASGAPVLGSLTSTAGDTTPAGAASTLTFQPQLSQFDSRDQFFVTTREYSIVRASTITCRYPSGASFHCLLGIEGDPRVTEACPATVPCRVRIRNFEGSGPVTVVARNPYGATAGIVVQASFPTQSYDETETHVFAGTELTTATLVTSGPDAPAELMPATQTCDRPYLAWRELRFEDPSGRATLARGITAGQPVTSATFPQWRIAPGPSQLSFRVTYVVETRVGRCQAL